MARPSLKAERTELILRSYEICIAKYGVDGATQQKISEEAGLARPLIRHFVGNTDELLAKVLERFMNRAQVEADYLKKVASSDELIEILFDSKEFVELEQVNDILIASAFLVASNQYPEIKAQMTVWFEQIRQAFIERLTAFYPKASAQEIEVVSIGVIGIYFNLYSMQSVYADKSFVENSKQSAIRLLETLNNT